MLKKGLIQVYTGSPEQPFFSPVGLCLRAAGHGFRTLICSFTSHELMDYLSMASSYLKPNLVVDLSATERVQTPSMENNSNPDKIIETFKLNKISENEKHVLDVYLKKLSDEELVELPVIIAESLCYYKPIYKPVLDDLYEKHKIIESEDKRSIPIHEITAILELISNHWDEILLIVDSLRIFVKNKLKIGNTKFDTKSELNNVIKFFTSLDKFINDNNERDD